MGDPIDTFKQQRMDRTAHSARDQGIMWGLGLLVAIAMMAALTFY